nr:outer membrane beta-barrel protein [Acidocella aromatica]
MRLHATQSDYKANYLTARTNEILAGVEDKADGLWTLSLLAGAAQRHSRDISVAAPVLEARLDWLPTQRDKVQLAVLREIDDPDEISATPYRLTEAKLSLEHSLLENVIVNGVAKVSNVAYMKGNSRETLVAASLEMGWYLTPNLALNGSYEFNNRQANYVSAASEHVVTMGLEWMP